jgi:CheY-like chemotaxis protein
MPLCFIVDDHADTREGFAEYLRDSGFEVRTARDSGELHTLLRADTPAAILMDVHMPGVTGWTLTRQIKADSRTRGVRVVVFLAKPCDPQVIVEALSRLLQLEPATTE